MSLQFLILSPLSPATQFYSWATGGGLIAQLCLTLRDPLDYKLPYSSDHEVFQARILEWVAISFSSASFRPRDWTCISRVSCIAGGFFTAEPPGKPKEFAKVTSSVIKGGSRGKEPACQCIKHKGHRFDPWVRKIPWRRAWQPTPVFLPGKPHGQRNLAGYSPWGRKEMDTTEQLSMHAWWDFQNLQYSCVIGVSCFRFWRW